MSRFRGGWSARPENALKRAEELENVGQKAAALQSLRDVITSKRQRPNWSQTYEDIMMKLMDLCVEMKRRNDAKEALMQYRNMCQSVNINSLEEVVKHFLNKATAKAEEARAQAEATSLDTVEDLDEDAKPEDLMLSYVSGDKSKDRTDRELVTPWFRFLWESHRSVLEILRTNPKLEALYAMAATRAFGFCLTYKRNAEFRRLCDILRQHLANMQKYRDARDLGAPEPWALHLETRFEQLRVACELGMWGEAFRSVEDIQGLITAGKRQPKQSLMVSYYARLTQIFKVSGAPLYHAYAWLKLFTFSRTLNKHLTPADLGAMATSVVLAALAVPAYDRAPFGRREEPAGADLERDKAARMAGILGVTVDKRGDARAALSRASLVAQISAAGLMALVPQEVRAAYELMTSEFAPLDLCTRLEPLLEQVSAIKAPMSAAAPLRDLDMADYVPALRAAAVVRMARQLSDVYSTMRIAELAKLVPGMPFGDAEAALVDAVKYGHLALRVDHRNGTVHFGGESLESDRLRGHLSALAERLARAAQMIDPRPATGRAEEARRAAVLRAREHVASEHKRLLARKLLIEKRKEQQEAALLEQEREEERRRQQAAREQEIQEERRRREEAARREKERIERELAEREQEEARQLLEQQAAKAGGKKKALLKDGDKIDKASLMKDVVAERLKEQAELERKLARLAKTLDHLERARREEEAPLIEAYYAQRAADEAKLREEQAKEAAQQHRAAWEADVVEKKRVARMQADADAFAAAVAARRAEEFADLRRAAEERTAERRAKAKYDREIQRRREFVRRARAAVAAKVREAEEAAEAAEAERMRAEREAERARLEEVAAKQRAKEEEIERKLREEKAAALGGGGGGGGGGAAPSGGNRFIPPALRKRMEAGEGGGGGGGGGGGDAAPERESWRESRPAPAAAAAGGGDRWGGGGGGGARPAPAAAASERPAPSAGAAPPAAGGGGGNRFVPPHLRRQMEAGGGGGGGGGEERPAAREEPERRSGAYRPPGSRPAGGW